MALDEIPEIEESLPQPPENDKPIPLVVAIAEHFEIEPTDILNYALIVKRKDGDKEIYSSAWPEGVPTDTLLGAIGTLEIHAQRTVA